jgi:GT2 family glycosyltransferase
MTAGTIQLSVIVLFYHGKPWIQNCIQSLENQSLARNKYEIIMVDNGGSTPSVGKYSEQPNIKVLHFLENFGFAGGNNKAMDHAEGDFVLLMNQDVVVHYNCLKELMAAFECYPKAGVVSANMVMVSAKNNIDQHNSTQETVGLYRLTRLGYASYLTIETPKNIVAVEFVSGNALCFRKSMLKDVGNYLFDERLGSYAEDLDLSIRLKHTKWEIYVRPNAVVYHYRDEAFSGSSVHRLRKLFRVSSNRLLVYYKNFSPSNFLRKLPALLLGIPFKVIRTDGARKIKLFNFFVALGFLPIIFVYFGLRVIQISKTEKRRSDISQKFSEQ